MSSNLRDRSQSRIRRHETSHSFNSSGRILPTSISPERGIDDHSRPEYPPSSSRYVESERQPRGRRRSISASDNSPMILSSSQTRSRHGDDYSSSQSTGYPPSSSSSGLGRRPARVRSLGPSSSRIPMPDPTETDMAGLARLVAERHDSSTSVQSPRARRPSQSSASFGLERTSSPQNISPIRSSRPEPAPFRSTLPTRQRLLGPGQRSSSTSTFHSTTPGYTSSSSGSSRRAPVSSAAASSSDSNPFLEGSSRAQPSTSNTLPAPATNIAPSGQRLRAVVNNPADYSDNPSGYSDQMSQSWSHFRAGTQLDREHTAYKSHMKEGDRAAARYKARAEELPVRSRSRHATGAELGSILDGRNYEGPEHLELGELAARARSSKKKAWEGRVDFIDDHPKFLKKKGFVSDINQVQHYEDQAKGQWNNAEAWKTKRDAHYEEAEKLGIRSSDIPPISSSDSGPDSRGESSRQPRDAEYYRQRRRERRRESRD